jgi:asparagine synthase (glutamine-hydrolysing)
MCGIFALLNNELSNADAVYKQFAKGKSRGPDNSSLDISENSKTIFGFHRLAINGLNQESNQPLVVNNIVLICNGEIYNYKELYKMANATPTTDSDCEVIIHLYLKYGIDQTLQMLDGEFAFILYDERFDAFANNKMFIARDPYGVKPLYQIIHVGEVYPYDNLYGFSSELKCLDSFAGQNPYQYKIVQFEPGTYSEFHLSDKQSALWKQFSTNVSYHIPAFAANRIENIDYVVEMMRNISGFLTDAVIKRCTVTEQPIACLLSGGLDSSLTTALVNDFYKKNMYSQPLETYSIGLAGSEDLKFAKIVADYLGTDHHEVIVTEQEMFDAIPEVIYAIESYDTTTVRASLGNYLIGKHISQNTNAKVIFNGDGSDELCGGYLYMNRCPDDIEFDRESRRLLRDIYLFDVLRSDKCISTHGLEPRPPFLDRSFVNYYLSLSPTIRNHNNNKTCEKFLLRQSFSQEYYTNYQGKQILPDEILWRRKEAFSDGVSNHGRSLFTILQEKISEYLLVTKNMQYPTTIETEKMYYKSLFDSYFPNSRNILPYYWMPRYTTATDPSARTLELYSAEKKAP